MWRSCLIAHLVAIFVRKFAKRLLSLLILQAPYFWDAHKAHALPTASFETPGLHVCIKQDHVQCRMLQASKDFLKDQQPQRALQDLAQAEIIAQELQDKRARRAVIRVRARALQQVSINKACSSFPLRYMCDLSCMHTSTAWQSARLAANR